MAEEKTALTTPSDRKFPNCLVCEKTSQDCLYPEGPLKPGPKIGSLRQRKRTLNGNDEDQDNGDAERHATRPRLESQTETTTFTQRSPSPRSETERGVSLMAESHDVPATVEGKVPDLAFILHPSHESPGSNRGPDPERYPCEDIYQRESFCSVLGFSWTEVEKL